MPLLSRKDKVGEILWLCYRPRNTSPYLREVLNSVPPNSYHGIKTAMTQQLLSTAGKSLT
jgi:hypothetical protein